MKTKLYALIALFISCNFLYSCSDDELASTGEYAGKGIQFGLGATSRTVYDTDDESQINWLSSDQITIHCAEAESAKSADYTVTPLATASKGTIAVSSGSTGLQWGGDTNEHHFYAVYPKGVAVDEKGIAKFPINHNQKVTVSTTNGYDNDVVATPDMENAYMVANTSTAPTDDDVVLEFKPIMTTLEIVITGASEGQNTSDAARITGISISSTTNSKVEGEHFNYDIVNSSIVQEIVTDNTPSTENIFIDLFDEEGNATYVDLAKSHTLKVTAFLPPMSTNDAAKLNRQVKIRVHATGNNELVASVKTDGTTDSWTTQLKPSAKRTITLPAIPSSNNETGNNWITPLDGNIYVSQMSIPGAHDAATGEGMVTPVGNLFAATQEQKLQTQWNLGVRAFDFRPALYDKNENLFLGTRDYELWLYHGMTRVAVSWATAMNTIKTNLHENPGEFAIVLFRHEDETTAYKNTSTDEFNTYMTNWVNANKNLIVYWKPDLTIDDCRGKIILISRFAGSWSYGCFAGWSHDAEGGTTTLKNADGSQIGTMYVQDYYNPSSHDAKWTSIQTYLDISKTFHTDLNKINHWMINHASGYVGSPSSSTYRSNAAAQNPKLIKYITSDTWGGSTGIMLFDYAGASLSNGLLGGSTEVYGDVALQTIIDNNYKYRMKRKGE